MGKYKIQFKEMGGKRYFDFSTRKLETKTEAEKLKKRAMKFQPNRTFRIKRRKR